MTMQSYVGNVALGPNPAMVTCPSCGEKVTTIVNREPYSTTWLFCLILCVLGCWCCAPCVFCADECLAARHYCPRCRSYLGTFA